MISIKQGEVTFLNVTIKPEFTLMELEGDNHINLCIVLIKLYSSHTLRGPASGEFSGPLTAQEAWD